MAGTTYQELLDGVKAYYGSDSDQWVNIARYGVNADTIPIIEQVPGVSITRSNSGAFLGFDYDNPFAGIGDPASIIDSNVQTGAYGQGSFNAQLPATAITDPSTAVTTMESGAISTTTGNTIASIADKLSLAVAGVALGTKLGKLIDSALYNADPEWWDTHYPTINPQTWDDIATTQGGKNLIRSIFGIENDNTTMYLDERLLAYTYLMLLQNGAYGSGISEATIEDTSFVPSGITLGQPIPIATTLTDYRMSTGQAINEYTSNGSGYFTQYIPSNETSGYIINMAYVSETQDIITHVAKDRNGQFISSETFNTTPVTVSNKTYYYYRLTSTEYYPPTSNNYTSMGTNVSRTMGGTRPTLLWTLAYAIFNGTIHSEDLPGVTNNPEAGEHVNPQTLINPTTGQPVTTEDDIDDVIQALRTQYPDLFNNSIYEDIPQSDGTTQRITYIPAPYPDTTNQAQPITDTTPGIDPQTDPQVNQDTRTEELLQQLVNSLTTDTTPPDTGEGSTPPAVIPTGSTNALYSIYNPTQVELNSFGAWLWSSNFVDQLLKLFNDPMQAIIGLHKVFAPPVISGTSTIKVGYLDSGVSSNVVGNQYTTIDCGTVNVSEFFGNVFDYDPFTQIYIYLPFVGIEKLDTGDVMRGVVGVKYHVDVLTGACLAEITVTRDGAGGIIYTFAGNCAVQYPISSGSYMGIVASLASIAGGVVGTVASGGALAPVTFGAVGGIMSAHTRVNHSGAFSGNAGAMGVKKPYLIITRPQTCLADDFPAYDGYPANKTTTLSTCSGFVKCETCHIENVPATDEELSEIESLLKTGVLI